MAHPGAATPRRLEEVRPRGRRKGLVLVARAPWPEAAEARGRWPRAGGLLLAVTISAALWALLIWGVCLLVG